MTVMDFDSSRLSKNLAERVKELDCLYKISRIATIHKNDIDIALKQIIEEIPNGWQFPELMGAHLTFQEQEYGILPSTNLFQSTIFQINKTVSATLTVYYKVSQKSQTAATFLLEEQALLNQIGFELSSLIEIDIKNKKEVLINERLLHSDRLNLLGEITAGIASELNIPLANILDSAKLLSTAELDDNKLKELDKILHATEHAKEIVKKLMYFSSSVPTEYELTNLNDLIKEAIDILKTQLTDKKIKVYLHLDENLAKLKLDQVQFSQVIFNLCINAIDAMKSGGTLTISTVGMNKDIRLKITDTGCGIPTNLLKKIFEPFHSTKDGAGYGLGLSVTHGIIHGHGGRIEVDSAIGKGSTFTIILKTE